MRQSIQSRRQHERPCQEDTPQSLAQIVYRFFFLVVTLRSTPRPLNFHVHKNVYLKSSSHSWLGLEMLRRLRSNACGGKPGNRRHIRQPMLWASWPTVAFTFVHDTLVLHRSLLLICDCSFFCTIHNCIAMAFHRLEPIEWIHYELS